MIKKTPLVACAFLVPFVLTACQTVHPQLLRDQSEPVIQEPEVTPANYQYQRQDIKINAILNISFAENKKANIINAINAKGDTILFDDQIFNTITIDVKDAKSLTDAILFYQTIDGVTKVSQDETAPK